MSFRDEQVNEIRIRAGMPVSAVCGSRTFESNVIADISDIEYILERASQYSLYSRRTQLCSGFIDFNGLRIGICGTAMMKEDALYSFSNICSLNIRIPREQKGILDDFSSHLSPPRSTLIVSPPGCGKTTALRELIRITSENGYRVSAADERNELAAKCGSAYNFDLGRNTDIMTDLSKLQSLGLLLRTMNPEIIAVDELGGHDEIELLRSASLNGVTVYATAHGRSRRDAEQKGLDFFEEYMVIKVCGGNRRYYFE